MPNSLTYKELQRAVTGMRNEVTRSSQAVHARAQQIDEEAQDTARVGEMIASRGVDTSTTSETRELSRIMAGLSDASLAYASAADTTAKTAQAAHDQARTTHNGIQEAVDRAVVDNIHGVDREWFRQE